MANTKEIIKLIDVNIILSQNRSIRIGNISICKGDKLLFKGPSGSGKTTIFKTILGFQNFEQGKFLYNGNLVDDRLYWLIRREISYVDQELSLPSNISVESFINYVSNLKYSGFDKSRVKQYFKYFELSENILDKKILELSGGEKQRISLIVSLCLNRNIFVLDEPTSFLDAKLKEKTANLFFNSQYTILVASHDNVWENYEFLKKAELINGKWETLN